MSDSIQASLAAVMESVRKVAKGDRNTAQNFSFRGIDSVVNAVAPALRQHNVIVMPQVEEHTFTQMTAGNGKSAMHVVLKVRYRFTGIQGDYLDAVVMGEAIDYGDKAVSKAMSVAFRIALLQALALPTDEVDPDAMSYERGSSKARTYTQGAKETVQVAREDDPWSAETKPQAEQISSAVQELWAKIEAAGTPQPVFCRKCDEPKKMVWSSGISKKNLPYGKHSCYPCSDVIWYVISSDTGFWRPQEAK